MNHIMYQVAIIGILCLAYGIYFLARISYFKRYSKNPIITQQDLTFGKSGHILRYIAAGDSTAVGEGASNISHSYAYRVATWLAQKNQVVYKNTAVIGATSQDLIDVQLQEIMNFNPDIVTISIGANDRTHLMANSTLYENFEIIIQALLSKTHAAIYLTDIPNFHNQTLLPLPYVWLLEYKTKSLNPTLLKLERERVKIVNIHDFGWEQYSDITQTISSDHFHPNDIGYENWANAFLDKIRHSFSLKEKTSHGAYQKASLGADKKELERYIMAK